MSKSEISADFSHLNAAGEANMVDVSGKPDSDRLAIARARIVLGEAIMQKVAEQDVGKGDLIATARIAGIQAAKKCADLIPLCHALPLDKVSIDFAAFSADGAHGLEIHAACRTSGKTGVEMEALTAASVAALTIYDMCKALDKGIVISDLRLLEKQGGKSGHWQASDD